MRLVRHTSPKSFKPGLREESLAEHCSIDVPTRYRRLLLCMNDVVIPIA